MRRPATLLRAFGPLLLALPLVAAEDDCQIRIVVAQEDGDEGEEGEGEEGEGEDPGDDRDGDGLPDELELQLGTDPENPDSDFDGIIDSEDPDSFGGDPCLNDPQLCGGGECQSDFDCGEGGLCFDGFCDYSQGYIDSDGDGLLDEEEINWLCTDPYNADTDGDGLLDSEDEDTWNNACNGGGGIVDSDGDGLDDETEAFLGTDPFNFDSDGDGLGDLDEIYLQTDPTNPDSDGDQLIDSEDPEPYVDTDQDGLSDYLEGLVGTSPELADTDGDGVSDGEEFWSQGTDPLDPTNGGGLCQDPDAGCEEPVEPQRCEADEECQSGLCLDGICA